MILLVDDDREVLRTLTQLLEVSGYTVVAVASPAEALERSSTLDEIDLLVSDICMAEMDGFELFRKLRLQRPRLRTLFLSGFIDPESLSGLDRRVKVLRKPVSKSDLKDCIENLLAF